MVDYSSWKTIELSSDEDDVHPFIENGTLFRLRHEARLKKMDERKQEEFALECHKASLTERFQKLERAIIENKKSGANSNKLELQMKELEAEKKLLEKKEIKFKNQNVSWYIDTICRPGFSKAIINDSKSENDSSENFTNFVLKNKPILKQFGLLQNFEETKNFLILNPQIICRHALYFLISYGIKIYLKKEKHLLKNISRQIVCLQHVLELFKMYNKNTEDILHSFFLSVKLADQQSKSNFEKESRKIQKLIKNLVKNEIAKIENLEENQENFISHKKDYTLDPEEVFQTLPKEMQYCFMIKDKSALMNILNNLPIEETEYHMKRCINSGLWMPGEDE